MKAKYLQVIIVTAISMFLSCNKDDESGSLGTANKFTYDGKDYSLTKGYIHQDIGTAFNVSFFSSGVTVTTNGGALFPEGDGQGFLLYLLSTTADDLSPAKYEWAAQSTPDSETILDAQLGIANDITHSISGTYRAAEYGIGSVTVSKSGSQYTIEFSFLVDGKTASGKYVGALQNY